jgi:hypothetical protein
MVDDPLTNKIDAQTDDFEVAIDDAIDRVEALEAALDRLDEKHGDGTLDTRPVGTITLTDTTSGAGASIVFDDVADQLRDEIDRRHQEGR